MPAALADLEGTPQARPSATIMPAQLPFPPLKIEHVQNCSFPSWYAKYKALTPKTRIIPLSSSFVTYLRSDGIMLPPETDVASTSNDTLDFDGDDDTEESGDPSQEWPQTHARIKETIEELGGKVYPKLDWSAPKDATWIAATNSMECWTPNDIYLLLKSSDFITHDLDQASVGCADQEDGGGSPRSERCPQFHLVLRKAIPSMITSMEFRCFVRRRRLIGVCQRDLNHFDFLPSLLPDLQDLIYDFFEQKLETSFPDESFTFDVYVPHPHQGGKVWLIDFNPWDARTDPLLFSWMELLTRPDQPEAPSLEESTVRLSLRPNEDAGGAAQSLQDQIDSGYNTKTDTEDEDDESDAEVDTIPAYYPEFRLVKRDDPEAYCFNTPLYSAHKMPKDVVDASMNVSGEGGMQDFMNNWRERVADTEARQAGDHSDDD